MEYLTFKPIYQERVWGGRSLESHLGRTLPEGAPIGESWEIVDRPEANSVVAEGALAGRTLGELRARWTRDLMGPGWRADRPFPILVKWLDCVERLSLQVHPPKAVAGKLKGEPKTENWFIAHATEEAALLAGLRKGVTRKAFEKALSENNLEDLICRLPSKAGDSLFVPSGRIHAIDGGNLILEIQQNSDTTYRVYDWGRVGLDGQPRQLHVQESMASIDFQDFEPQLIHAEGTRQTLAESEEFALRRIHLRAAETLAFLPDEQPRILSVVSGSLSVDAGKIVHPAGSNLLLPYIRGFAFLAREPTTVLVTENFA
ncbi:MAG: class I mannose-6-phosphate isomerase [Opitutales bacterium]|nr:class I mannose-6-phosphate isomerase [Opitutales bacterium]